VSENNRLRALAAALPCWLRIDREALKTRIVEQVLAEYRAMPSPDHVEGIETGLDFLGLLLTEGGDNGLYESTMQRLDSDIYSVVAALDDDEQIVLLLPMEEGDLEDLFRDRDIDEWPRALRAGIAWPDTLRDFVLNHVERKDRLYASESGDDDDEDVEEAKNKEVAITLFQNVIDGNVPDILAPELADEMETAYLPLQGDPEIEALFERAANAYQKAVLGDFAAFIKDSSNEC